MHLQRTRIRWPRVPRISEKSLLPRVASSSSRLGLVARRPECITLSGRCLIRRITGLLSGFHINQDYLSSRKSVFGTCSIPGGTSKAAIALTTKYIGTVVPNEARITVNPRSPKMTQIRTEIVKLKGNINLTGKDKVFRITLQAGHGNPCDCHVGICFGEITSPHLGHLLSNLVKCRWSLSLVSSVLLLGASSSGDGETKQKSAYVTKDKRTELSNSATIAIELRTPNEKQAPIVRKSVSTQAHFQREALLRNNCPHLGHGNPPDSQIGICLGEIIPQQAGHSLS